MRLYTIDIVGNNHQSVSVLLARIRRRKHYSRHRPGPTQPDAAITATCVRAHVFLTNPYASCSDCCIVLCWSWSVVAVVVVVECCCCIPCRLVLMLVLTFAPFVLTFTPCGCGVILLSTSARTPLAPMVVVTGCNRRWCRISISHSLSRTCAITGHRKCPDDDSNLGRTRTDTEHKKCSSSHNAVQREERLAVERLQHLPFFITSSYYTCTLPYTSFSLLYVYSYFFPIPSLLLLIS